MPNKPQSNLLSGDSTAAMDIPYRELGKTGQRVSCIGLGGSHIGKDEKLNEAESIRLIRRALDSGLNFLDNCWDYNDGHSEKRMGKALQDGYRDKAFLMTKFDGRDKKSAAQQIDESLRRLKTDHVDLMQFHEVIRFDDVDRFFAEGGAVEALTEARESGKTRYVGFTGHKDPHIHLYMLELADRHGFTFDTVQMPLNLLDFHYRSFEQLVLPELVARRIGVLGMKSMAGGVLLKAGFATAEQCLRYALRLPLSTVITGIDSEEILDQALRVAKGSTKPMSDDELEVLREPARKHAMEGKFELFKTSAFYDSTAKNPDYLGDDTSQVVEMGA
jgi:uncharacterized protein